MKKSEWDVLSKEIERCRKLSENRKKLKKCPFKECRPCRKIRFCVRFYDDEGRCYSCTKCEKCEIKEEEEKKYWKEWNKAVAEIFKIEAKWEADTKSGKTTLNALEYYEEWERKAKEKKRKRKENAEKRKEDEEKRKAEERRKEEMAWEEIVKADGRPFKEREDYDSDVEFEKERELAEEDLRKNDLYYKE